MTDSDVKKILSGEDKSLKASVLRLLLLPLSYLHLIGLWIFLIPYKLGIRKQFVLPVPVIVIGNLTSGGTGKTPMTIYVARLLQQKGKKVVILSRGHGSKSEKGKSVRVVSDERSVLLNAESAGDEPLLLAKSLPGVPVLVGKDRRVSGIMAVEKFAPDIILLDDALQFWQLHRDLNIILVDATRPFDNGYVLPRGLLREPPSHLSRADFIVLTRADRDEGLAKTRGLCEKYAPGVPVLTAKHKPVGWVKVGEEEVLPLNTFTGRKIAAFCGIASPEVFRQTLLDLGVNIAQWRAFPNHHAYSKEDIEAFMAGETVLVTTEKDAVKLVEKGNFASLYALRVELELSDPKQMRESLLRP